VCIARFSLVGTVVHHATSFRRAAHDDALADAVLADWRAAQLSPADQALAELAESLTRDPGADAAPRLARLRAAGFGDEAILRATEITGYFNFVNRMADGLGVELEEA
jgi:uncharacterized peroxidase-related enzyme